MSGINEIAVRGGGDGGSGGGGGLFRDIDADDAASKPTVIESLCMNCHDNGVTRMLLSRIPFFKEVIVSSFRCDHCQWSNTEVQSAGRIQDRGVRFTVRIRTRADLDREVVRSDSAVTRIPELDFEVPAFTQKGSLSTVEGVLDRAAAALEQDQPVRRATLPDVAQQIDAFVGRLRRLKELEEGFTLVVEDISGNSFVENPVAPQRDDAMTVSHFARTAEQDEQLGLAPGSQAEPEAEEEQEQPATTTLTPDAMREEVLQFPTNCPDCNAPASTNMKMVQIPHFKEVIIMATNCDECGHRTNEVKSGGGTEPRGTRITLHVTDVSDMSRDVLKSETCGILIPELECELGMAVLGGKFTTLEGLLCNIKELVVSKNPFTCGDSGTADRTEKLQAFGDKLDRIIAGDMDAHVVLDDPAGNSYMQNVYAPEPDPEMTIEHYTRTEEQDQDLGIHDMKTEGYED